MILAVSGDVAAAGVGALTVAVAALARRVIQWGDQLRGYAERVAALEQRLTDLERSLQIRRGRGRR